MGYKSRINWRIGLCMKFDCKNRNQKCESCIRFSKYEKNEDKQTKTN